MTRFKSNFKEMSFYGSSGNLKKFSDGVYTTDDVKEIAILKKTPYVSLVSKTKEEMKAEAKAAAKVVDQVDAAKDTEDTKNPSKFSKA